MSIYRGAGGAGDATNNATSQSILAAESAQQAAASAAAAAASASQAATSATNSASSATASANSATAAASSANSASTSATNAASSASTATTQASNAASSATAAATSASNAATSETNAANSASAAATSATNASNSASSASTSATNASNSASAAATSATNAAASAIDAQSSEDAAAAYAASINPANFLTKANNLSDLTNTSTARNNLGVAIGTNVQAYSSELQAISNGGGNAMFKNRIINGDMRIDQRNAGASVTPANLNYTVDRWLAVLSQSAKYSVQQNAGSVTPPANFSNYLGVTSLSAYSITSTDIFGLQHRIEGLNTADLSWGTANASAVTLSFKVYSSLTGIFGGAINNSAFNRTYPFTYSIPVANTWTTISITIPGDTTGTWLTTNGIGLVVIFGLGVGSTYSATAGAWGTSGAYSATGATSVVGTNGATFYITGVQLEKGSTATSFDYRPYGTELALCQRYYNKSYSIDVVPGTNTGAGTWRSVSAGGAGWVNFDFPVEMRAVPTVTPYNIAGTSGVYGSDAGNWTPTATYISTRRHSANGLVTSSNFVYGHYVASIEL